MDHNYSITKDTQHGRGKHLKFEERCSIKKRNSRNKKTIKKDIKNINKHKWKLFVKV